MVQRRLIDAAEEIMRSGEPEKLTAGAVTAAAGIARNSIYRYVDSVDDLRGLVLARHLPAWIDAVAAELEAVEAPTERIVVWVRANLQQAARTGHGWLMGLSRSITPSPATALASASVAQVHAATLQSGEDVVVKVLRPGVEKAVAADIALMYQLARLANCTSDGRRLRPVEVVREFENTLANELDLMFEAANASQLRANFKNSPLLYVPEVHWRYCRKNVMVMERIRATNIADETAIHAAGTNLKVLAERGVEIFFTQVFRDSFFHADMHPGNIFVYTDQPETPRYCAIDFGIMGSLTPEDQHYLAENFLAFFNRDYRRVAELHVESGWVPRDTRVTDFEAAIRKVSEPIFGKPIKEISFGAFLVSLFQTARRFNMHIQPQLVLLQKTFFNVEGLGRRLSPRRNS